MKFKDINRKNADYDANKIIKRKLLYRGGEELLSKAALFINREPMESAKTYQSRLKSASYENYNAQIINDFTSSVFEKQFSVLPSADNTDGSTPGDELADNSPYWREFAADVDLKGHSLSDFMSHQLTDAQKYDHSFTLVDFKTPASLTGQEDLTKQQAQDIKANRGYLMELPVSSVINWAADDLDNWLFCVLRNDIVEQKAWNLPPEKTIVFTVWQNKDNVVSWQKWFIKCENNKEPSDNDEVKELTPENKTNYSRIPIFKMCLPYPLRTGCLISNLVVDHFNLNSALTYAINRNLFSILVVKLGAELPANPLEINGTQSDESRGHKALQDVKEKVGIIVGKDDEVEFVEPKGTIYELAQSRLKDKVTSIHQIVNQMGYNLAGSKSISAMAKMMDKHSKQLAVQAYAHVVIQSTLEIYNFISETRGEDIVWQPLGLDNYQQYDITEIMDEAMNVMSVPIPSKTFKKRHFVDVAFKVEPNLDAATRISIQNEIDDYVDKADIEDLMGKEQPDAQDEELIKDKGKE